MVKRTERGWAGHYICSQECQFRRNTLLENGDIRIVVSTVGRMLRKLTYVEIGCGRYFETMAFHAYREDGRYWDADVTKQVYFDAPWAIAEIDSDDKANDMHEAVVDEIIAKLESGIIKEWQEPVYD